MIQSLVTYLVTNNNGKEAVSFYEKALGAKCTYITYWKDHVPNCPKEAEDYVMNAQLEVDGLRIMLSDNGPEYPWVSGGQMTACFMMDTVENAKKLYEALSEGAQDIQMPLGETFWSPAYASFTDKFGISWQINVEVPVEAYK